MKKLKQLYFKTRREAQAKVKELKVTNPTAKFVDNGAFSTKNKRWEARYTEVAAVPIANVQLTPIDAALQKLKAKAQDATGFKLTHVAPLGKAVEIKTPTPMPVHITGPKLAWSMTETMISFSDVNGNLTTIHTNHHKFLDVKAAIFRNDIQEAFKLATTQATLKIDNGIIYFGDKIVDFVGIIGNAEKDQIERIERALGLIE